MGTSRIGCKSHISFRACFGVKRLKLSLALLLSGVVLVTLIQTQWGKKLAPQSNTRSFLNKILNSESRNNIEKESDPTHLRGYTAYTIRRLGLTPLTAEPLEPNMGKVINDVLSFRYSIEIDPNSSRCTSWRNRTWLDLIAAYDDDMNANRTLLIAVVSAAENFSKRKLIRKTWGTSENLKADWIQLIFLVGTLSSDKDEERGEVQNLLVEESIMYKDMVQVEVTDNYDKLTLKSVSLLYWALTRCPGAQLVLKCDDDTYINFETLNELLAEEQFVYADRIYGVAVFDNKPQRDSGNKYYISREVWPWSRYPTFLSGGAYILGRDSIRPLLGAVQTTPLFPLEDVYLTGLCARKAKIPFLSSQRIYERFVPRKLNPCFVRSTAMWQTQARLTLLQSHEITKRVYANSLPCRSSCKYLGVC